MPSQAWVHRARYVGVSGGKPAEVLAGTQGLERALTRARLQLRRLVVPDENATWAVTAIPAGIRLVREHGIDVVVSTSPPPSTHLIAAAIARATGVRWVADLRDSLVSHAHRRADTTATKAKAALHERVAKLVASRADAITCVSEAISVETRSLEPKGPVVTIPNGADFDDVAGLERHPSDRFRITHTGSFFGRRDPRPFLQALADSGLDVVARFLGDFRDADREWVEGLGLGDRLELLPYAPRAESLALQRDSEALLLLIPEADGRGKGVLSGKVFEYVAVGRPILAAVPPDGAAAELIRETGAGVVARPKILRRSGPRSRSSTGIGGAAGSLTSSSRPNGATGSRGAPASRRWRPSCALRSTDRRSARTVLRRTRSTRADRRPLLRRRHASSRWRGSIHAPSRTRTRPPGRTPGSTPSIVSSAAATRCFRRRRSRSRRGDASPRTGTFAVAVGPRQPGWSSLAIPPTLENYMRYFLLPRRTDPGAPWILCFACDRAAFPGARAVWEDTEQRLVDPEAAAVTVRALGGLVVPEPRLRSRGPLAALGACAHSARGAHVAPPRRASGICVGLAAFGVLWTALLVARRALRRESGSSSRSLCLAAVGVSAGMACAACTPKRGPASSAGTPTVLVPPSGVALAGLFLEALFRAARLLSLQAVRRVGVLGAEGQGDLLLRRARRAGLHDDAEPVVSAAAARSSTPRRSTRWAGRTSSRCTCSSGSSSSAPSRAAAGLLHRHAPAWLLWPPLLLVLVVPRFGERLHGRLRPTSSWTSSSSSRHCSLALWLRDAARLAARRGRGAARRCGATRSARASSSLRACSPLRSSPRGRAAGRGSLAASLAVGLAVLPWRLWTARHDIAVRRAVVVRPTGYGAPSASRSTSSTRTHAGRCCLSSARSRSCAAAVWGDRRLAAYVGVLAAAAVRRRRLVDGRLPGSRDHRRRVGQPDRALHGVARLPGGRRRSAAAGLGLARAVRSPDRVAHTPRRCGDRRGPARRLPARRRRGRGAVPVARRLRPAGAAGVDRAARPRLRPSRHARRG